MAKPLRSIVEDVHINPFLSLSPAARVQLIKVLAEKLDIAIDEPAAEQAWRELRASRDREAQLRAAVTIEEDFAALEDVLR